MLKTIIRSGTTFTVIRFLIALLFILSGWVKAVDPMGTYLKIGDYLVAFGLNINNDLTMVAAIIFCSVELLLGIMLLLRMCERIVMLLITLMMLFFTILTGVIVLFPSLDVKECGCFGDAIAISMGATFIKNIIMSALAMIYIRRIWFNEADMKNGSRIIKMALYLSVLFFSFSIPIYSILYLPPYTYITYDIGHNLRNDIADEEVTTILVYKNIATGKIHEFDINSTEWHDESKWEYVDTKSSIDGKEIKDVDLSFSIYDRNQNNVTDSIVNFDGYIFMVIGEDIKAINKMNLNNVIPLHNSVRTAIITSTPYSEAKDYIDNNLNIFSGIEIYSADNILIKSLIRDRGGIMLVKDGEIIAKWNSRLKAIKSISYNNLDDIVNRERGRKSRFIGFVALFISAILALYFLNERRRYDKVID